MPTTSEYLRRKCADPIERDLIIDLAVDADRHAVRPLAFPGRMDLMVDGYGVTVGRGE